jgi:hypothetical protein
MIRCFYRLPTDCYSVEQHPIKIGMAVFRQPVLYLSAKTLRAELSDRGQRRCETTLVRAPKSKECSRTKPIADAHRSDGKRFVVQADEKKLHRFVGPGARSAKNAGLIFARLFGWIVACLPLMEAAIRI